MRLRRTYRYILALSIVCSLAAFFPQQTFAQAEKGIELYNSGAYQKAEAMLRAAVNTESGNVAARYYLGLSVLQQGKYSDALDIFQKARSQRLKADQRTRAAVPSELQLQLALARAHLGLKQYAEAWKNLESARIEDGSASDVYLYRGVYYYQQKKNAEAIKELEKSISLDANNAYAYYYAGLAYADSGNGEKAVDTLKIFLKLAPDAPEAAKAKELVDSLC